MGHGSYPIQHPLSVNQLTSVSYSKDGGWFDWKSQRGLTEGTVTFKIVIHDSIVMQVRLSQAVGVHVLHENTEGREARGLRFIRWIILARFGMKHWVVCKANRFTYLQRHVSFRYLSAKLRPWGNFDHYVYVPLTVMFTFLCVTLFQHSNILYMCVYLELCTLKSGEIE